MPKKQILPLGKVVSRKLIKYEGLVLSKNPAAYIIANEESNNFYIGSTKNISGRINAHKFSLSNNNHSNVNLQNDYNNTKDKSKIKVHLILTESKNVSLDIEQDLLDKNFNLKENLNISNNARNPTLGYDRSEIYHKSSLRSKTKENRERVSDESKKRWEDQELRKKMIKGMGENVIVNGKEYGSVREASREECVSIATIRRRLIDNKCSLNDIRPSKKIVICEGNQYESVDEAASFYGIKANTMVYRLKNKNKKWDNFNYA